jgi:hypothetical protein
MHLHKYIQFTAIYTTRPIDVLMSCLLAVTCFVLYFVSIIHSSSEAECVLVRVLHALHAGSST